MKAEIVNSGHGAVLIGVMTDEVGVITGELELQTRATPDDSGIEAMVRYAGAQDLYTVSGSPVRAASLSERAG